VKKDPRVYLTHILECIGKIERFTQGGREAFINDAMIQDAVIRNLEIIGEATKRIPDAYRASHPEIPWRSMAAMRDVLIHQYEGVDLAQVWAGVEIHLPVVKRVLQGILPPPDELEREIAGEQDAGYGGQ